MILTKIIFLNTIVLVQIVQLYFLLNKVPLVVILTCLLYLKHINTNWIVLKQVEYYLASNLLALPIDQRYSIDNLVRIKKIINYE